jgi:hypothetical protein
MAMGNGLRDSTGQLVCFDTSSSFPVQSCSFRLDTLNLELGPVTKSHQLPQRSSQQLDIFHSGTVTHQADAPDFALQWTKAGADLDIEIIV